LCPCVYDLQYEAVGHPAPDNEIKIYHLPKKYKKKKKTVPIINPFCALKYFDLTYLSKYMPIWKVVK